MSEEMKKEDIEKILYPQDKWSTTDGWLFLIVFLALFSGFGNNDNSRINELEKKVARLEGQMSMIGGKTL